MTKKKHEELVEEIADYLQASYAMGQHDYKLGVGYGETPRKWDRDRAKKIIAATLSAFHDGRLDEELGVVGRTTYRFGQKGIGLGCRKGDIIIALREQEEK